MNLEWKRKQQRLQWLQNARAKKKATEVVVVKKSDAGGREGFGGQSRKKAKKEEEARSGEAEREREVAAPSLLGFCGLFFSFLFSSPSLRSNGEGGGDLCCPNEQVRPVRLRGQHWAAPSQFMLGGLWEKAAG